MGLFLNGGQGALKVPSVPYDKGNFDVAYEYYSDGKISKETLTGDVNRETTYTYVQSGVNNEGKILMEVIKEHNKRISRIFSYDSKGKITKVQQNTTDVVEGDGL